MEKEKRNNAEKINDREFMVEKVTQLPWLETSTSLEVCMNLEEMKDLVASFWGLSYIFVVQQTIKVQQTAQFLHEMENWLLYFNKMALSSFLILSFRMN